ncbi:MAG: septum site-determining protein MinC [Oleiphilaceae bacterium]|jgi:septum site-determining protein MinC
MSSTTAPPLHQDQAESSLLHNKQGHNGQPCLKLKGSLVPMTALELSYYDKEQLKADLSAKVSQAPEFFKNLPVVISLEKLDEHEQVDFKQIIEACADFSIKVVAVRGGSEHQQTAAKQSGLGLLSKQKDRSNDDSIATQEQTPQIQTETIEVEVIKTVVQHERQQSKVVRHPIRSGQQVYAADGDLIVLASVSAGAEILADGNIHVYGTLRGRALAGVKGDTSARIFCQSLEAELVSVAGQYKVREDFDENVVRKASQIFLNEDKLCFKELGS